MQANEPTVALTVRLSAATHRALQRLAQQEHRSLAGQAAYLPAQALAVGERGGRGRGGAGQAACLREQALAVEERVRRVLAAERAEHWAQQARGPGGGGPEGQRA